MRATFTVRLKLKTEERDETGRCRGHLRIIQQSSPLTKITSTTDYTPENLKQVKKELNAWLVGSGQFWLRDLGLEAIEDIGSDNKSPKRCL